MNISTKFRSPNYSIRNGSINFIIIHYTELSFDDALDSYCDPEVKLSAHYFIKSNGEIFNLVDDQYAAWHAGKSYWKGLEQLNEYSIGIELDNLGTTPFPLEQMNACVNLCEQLSRAYNIHPSNIIGHSDIAPDRKIDPGIFFDWSYLAKYNLGAWHNINTNYSSLTSNGLFKFGDMSAEISNLQDKLKKFGYKLKVTGIFDSETNSVIRAFQSHFYPNLISKLGIEFYRNLNNEYFWDTISNEILVDLVKHS